MSSPIDRRQMLRGLGSAALMACPACQALAQEKETHHGAPHWTYEGEGRPQRWGHLSDDFKACALGQEQTPIDLRGGSGAEAGVVQPSFQPMPLTIVNNGHTIQVECAPGSRTLIDGQAFELLQFHFHHPSEHLLAGRRFDLELHFVHKSAAGQLAVLGVFIRPGGENAALAPIWAGMPRKDGQTRLISTRIEPGALLPAKRQYFRYSGSLTTPPCSEGLLWIVFKEPIEASRQQIGQFAALFPVNARPLQPLNSRPLLESN